MTDDDNPQLGDQPIEAHYREQMKAVASALDGIFNLGQKHPNKSTGFVLLVFPYGSQDGRCNFISNGADREDIVKMFKEMILRFEESK